MCFHRLRLIPLVFSLLLIGATAHAQGAAAPAASGSLRAQEVLANTGHGEDALKQLDALAATQPHTAGLNRVRGVALYNLDRFTEAEKAFAAAMADDPADQEAAQMRGLTLFRLGRPADAIPLLEGTHTEGVQKKADPTYVLALCYVDTRRYDDARRAYAQQYGLAPDSAAAYLLAGRMLLRREYLPVAQRFGTEAVRLDPSLPLAHELLGEIALAGNQLDVAQHEFELEVKANPVEAAPYDRLGDLYSRQGRYAEARIALQRAVLLEPNSTGPYILLGRTALREGDAVAALTYLQRANRMDPSSAMTHNLLAQAYRTMNRGEDAARELSIVEKLHAADEPKLNTLH